MLAPGTEGSNANPTGTMVRPAAARWCGSAGGCRSAGPPPGPTPQSDRVGRPSSV